MGSKTSILTSQGISKFASYRSQKTHVAKEFKVFRGALVVAIPTSFCPTVSIVQLRFPHKLFRLWNLPKKQPQLFANRGPPPSSNVRKKANAVIHVCSNVCSFPRSQTLLSFYQPLRQTFFASLISMGWRKHAFWYAFLKKIQKTSPKKNQIQTIFHRPSAMRWDRSGNCNTAQKSPVTEATFRFWASSHHRLRWLRWQQNNRIVSECKLLKSNPLNPTQTRSQGN